MALPALKSSDNRKDTRGRVDYRIHFSVRGRRHAGDGYMANLSLSGCCVKSSVAVQQGDTLELTIQGSDGSGIVIDESVVRWVRPDGFGVSFTRMRRPASRWIADSCRRLSLHR